MPTYRESAVAYLQEVIDHTGRTASELAEMVGVSHTTFTRPLKNPDYKYAPKFPKLQRLSEMTGVPLPQDLVKHNHQNSTGAAQIKTLPVKGKVAAGLWLEIDLLTDEPLGWAPMVADPLYADVEQWAMVVDGPSMNRHYRQGDFVHVISLIDSGHQLESGDHVIVERRSGGKIERTCKVVEVRGDGYRVRGDSTDEKWNQPIDIIAGSTEAAEIEIVGFVIGSYRPRTARQKGGRAVY